MIRIEYTSETLESEPRPNFYWFGEPQDFLQLSHDLHLLGQKNGQRISFRDLPYVKILGDIDYIGNSVEKGNWLVKKTVNHVETSLDAELWQKLLSQFYGISFQPKHDYLDFDGYNLKEDANFIISSEVNTLHFKI